jgi:hypothetical protein
MSKKSKANKLKELLDYLYQKQYEALQEYERLKKENDEHTDKIDEHAVNINRFIMCEIIGKKHMINETISKLTKYIQ